MLTQHHHQNAHYAQAVNQQQRLEESVARAMRVQVERWGVKEVCDWAEYVGLGQYRKRFLHHCIGGGLLLELTEQNLKVRCRSHCGRQIKHCYELCTLRSGLRLMRCMHATL